ncbi:two-component system response regulator CreB [Luteolibacter pohnpeiensis]|uniref:Two-component system response regulator CreB n=1 Tax=Luteolibacter pohnpeiensis TaxID=454153 RepID=A0A934VV80_9BACT|nr:two-component system response regulator CreB [Luteolibacter pohnpeiensis]MBK1883297.1 two-component system response regulator CreB [Luteolibacter pohnpeiensis]
MPHILLVEDEPAIADTLLYALGTDCFEVTHALTGADAIAAFKEISFDFVILDIGLPDMTGLDVCRRLRKVTHVPILFLTARSGEVDRILGLELGGDDYVTKPFSPREVVARVRAILRRSPELRDEESPSESVNELGLASSFFHHDDSSMRVHCHGIALDLTAHEYKLLLVLIKQPGRVFTREQLLDKAWADPGAVTDRTVDAHIKSIRAKLREVRLGAEDCIQTRRGLGYLFDIG